MHRPYLDLAESSAPNMTDAQGQQRQAMISLRRYLEDRNVSSALIEKMMAHTSKNIYWLRAQDLNFLYASPEYEELLASNCEYRRTIINAESSRRDTEAYLHESSGQVQDKLRTCSRALLTRLRTKELPDLFLRLNQGWRPWS